MGFILVAGRQLNCQNRVSLLGTVAHPRSDGTPGATDRVPFYCCV